jgi:hypothetical protein
MVPSGEYTDELTKKNGVWRMGVACDVSGTFGGSLERQDPFDGMANDC